MTFFESGHLYGITDMKYDEHRINLETFSVNKLFLRSLTIKVQYNFKNLIKFHIYSSIPEVYYIMLTFGVTEY